MFKKIMVPVDLAHLGDLRKALDCAVDLGRHYKAEIVYVGVTSSLPGALAHTPEEYRDKLKVFADEQIGATGISASVEMVLSHDPTVDVDDKLMQAIARSGADLVVMQSHMPSVVDYIWPSNGGKIAEHAPCSVMVVRG